MACQLHQAVFALEQTVDSTKDKALATARQALCDDLRLAAQLADKATNTAKSEVSQVQQALGTALADAGKAVAKVDGLANGAVSKVDKVEDEAARELAHISKVIGDVQITGNVLANAGVSAEGSAKVGNLFKSTVDVDSSTQTAIKLRGAIHEAFAKPYVSHVDLVTVTSQTPPADLKEQAAASAVAKGMTFVGGYWNWNSVDGKFDWVNGMARRAPAGCHWVPGQWVQTDNGFARVPGAWVSDKASGPAKVQNLPMVTDLGRKGARPGVDRFWIPPSHANVNGKLQETAGFWSKATSQNSKLVWVPGQTIAMPGKTVFVNGYWDHRLTERGVLHAPVDISEGANSQAASALASVVKLDIQRVFLHTFVDGKTQHYLFGNFYGAAAEQAGIKSWVASATGVKGYDPLFEHYDRTYAAAGGNLAARLMGWNQFFQQNPQLCPPATLPELAQFLKANPSGQARTAAVLVSGLDAQAGRQLVAAGDIDGKELTMLQATLGSLNTNLVSVGSLTGTGAASLTNLTGSSSVLGGTVGGLSGNLGLGNTGAGAIGGLGGMTSIGGTGGLGGVGAVGGLGGVGGVAGGVGSVGGIGGASAVGGASGLLGGAGGVGGLLK
ncbi:MAG: hypothetical protein HY290_05820 [Planctomycetia bacterium]|nr:hypothetical protein [Planctomycetia bacterium]